MAVLALLLVSCTTDKAPTRPPGGPSSTSTLPMPTGTQRIAFAGLSVEVPADWPVVAVPQQTCRDLAAPSVVVGAFDEVRGCRVLASAHGPAITIGHGGPPSPPIPTAAPTAEAFNAVPTLISFADHSILDESALLATFPGRDAWMQVAVVGGNGQAVFDEAKRILSTISVDTAEPVHPSDPGPASFVGRWHVHGAQLDLDADTGVLTANCGSPCVERHELSLSLSPDGRRLTAVITGVSHVNASTGQPSRTQAPSAASASRSTSSWSPHT